MIRIHRSSDNQFYFVVVATNGQTLATSETYTRKEKAVQSAKALIELLSPDTMILVDIRTTKMKSKVKKAKQSTLQLP